MLNFGAKKVTAKSFFRGSAPDIAQLIFSVAFFPDRIVTLSEKEIEECVTELVRREVEDPKLLELLQSELKRRSSKLYKVLK